MRPHVARSRTRDVIDTDSRSEVVARSSRAERAFFTKHVGGGSTCGLQKRLRRSGRRRSGGCTRRRIAVLAVPH